MSREPVNRINVKVGRDLSGQLVIGDRNKVVSGLEARAATVSEHDELRTLIDQLRALLDVQADDVATEGSAQLDELEDVIAAGKPDLGKLQRICDWFKKKIPELAGTIGKIVVSPLVAELTAAASDDLSAEVSRHLGP